MYMYICMCVCVSLSLSLYIYIYIYYIYIYIYPCMHVLRICIFICSSMYIYVYRYVCVGTHFCLYKSYLFNCLSCRYICGYLPVWNCYLGSILAFLFEIVNLNTTTCTKCSTQVIKINLGNMNSLCPTLVVNNSDCMYLFI